MRRLAAPMCLFLLGVSAGALPAVGSQQSYTYDYWGEPVPAPEPYRLVRVLGGSDVGIGELDKPFDVLVVEDGGVFISDMGRNRVVRLGPDLEVTMVLQEFDNAGSVDTFHSPSGLSVAQNGELYVVDSEAGRILQFSPDGKLLRVVGGPEADLGGVIPQDFVYKPLKVTVGRTEKLYVIAEGVYDGLMELDISGKFVGFVGAPKVTPTVAEVFWSVFATEEQKLRVSLFLPTEYNALDLDPRGFIFVAERNRIKRLNPTGEDVFVSKAFFRPVGDVPVADSATEKPSYFVDIAARENGMFSVLDLQRGRIFTYDSIGNLLYVFGGLGSTKPLFRSPSAIDAIGDQLVVLDRNLCRLFVFEPLPYARAIHDAVAYYETGDYDRATSAWREVLSLNANYDLAYSGIARSYLQKGEYREAMESFRLGNNRKGYSEAFQLYRRHFLAERFGLAVLVLVLAMAVVVAFRRLKPATLLLAGLGLLDESPPTSRAGAMHVTTRVPRQADPGRMLAHVRRTTTALLYARHVIFHPFDGFWDIKHEKRGNATAAGILLFLLCAVYVFSQLYTGFILNHRDLKQLNVLGEFASILVPFFLWCVVSWALSILLDGKGTFKEIAITSAYATVPIILFYVPLTILSRFIVQEEAAFYYVLLVICLVWAAFLLFGGTLTIHEYSVGRTIASALLTIVGIGAVIFIGLLFLSVVNLMAGFVSSVYNEMVLRF